ncbi:MAG: hypothetical protein C0425_07650 [Chlorobiaceae bacterium]|nr:hypothetical protein [Chlorobiaceae bacterium]MBA4310196.1 hypothetical protein [Chlorobiaceae bacterium]
MLAEIIIILILLIANGVFALSEIAIVSSRKTKLETLAKKGNKRAETALILANSPSIFLSTIQTGITLIGIFAGVFSGATMADEFAAVINLIPPLQPYSELLGFILIVIIITYFSLIIGELVPKRIAMNNPEKFAIIVAPAMLLLANIGKPIIKILGFSTELILKILNIKQKSEVSVAEDEIKMLISEGTKTGEIEKTEQELFESVFSLGDKRVEAFMTPRAKIEWLDLNAPDEENIKKIKKSIYSKIPVCDGDIENIVGIIRVNSLLSDPNWENNLNLRERVIIPIIIPEGTKALKLLEIFKENKKHFAIIINEFGGVQGLITINDIVEELVGTMPIEEELPEPLAIQREDGSWLLDGAIGLNQFKEILKIESIDGEETGAFQTLGGFVMMKLGKVPKSGDKFYFNNLCFEIVDMDRNRVDKVLVS